MATPCGLVRRDMTCYLNVILQTIFHTKEIRQIILQLPENTIDRPLISAMKKVFSQLENAKEPVEKDEVVYELQKYGKCLNLMAQQDAHAYLRFILNRIEEELIGTIPANLVPFLFPMNTYSHIKCTNVVFEQNSATVRMDELQLNILTTNTSSINFKKILCCFHYNNIGLY